MKTSRATSLLLTATLLLAACASDEDRASGATTDDTIRAQGTEDAALDGFPITIEKGGDDD